MKAEEIQIVLFELSHAEAVRSLFTEVNFELAPIGLRKAFDIYVRRALDEEINRISEYFDPRSGSGFWVLMHADRVIGMFGLERKSADIVELRRMYLQRSFRGQGLADRMLARAETEALRLGYGRLVLSTAEIQAAAVAFYRRTGFREVGSAAAAIGDHKSVGGDLIRLYFEKELVAPPKVRERLVRWEDPIELTSAARKMSGRDFLETVLRGDLSLPPICNLLDFSFEEFGEGCAVMVLRPCEAQYNPIGSVHGGVIATVLDSVMGCAVHTKLPAGQGYTTLEIKVNYLRVVSLESGYMRAIGKVVHAGRKTAMAEGTLVDASGKIHAQASTTCLLYPIQPPS